MTPAAPAAAAPAAMALFVVRDMPRFGDLLREDTDARRLLLRPLLFVDAERLFFRDAERLFVREDALRRLPAERFLDDDLERLRDDDFFFDAIRFLLVRTYQGGTRTTVGNCVAWT
jgi:hypothetical protein